MLDLKDRKILYELDKNARQPDTAIGKSVQLSGEVVNYRIDKLLEKGIIKNFVTLLNHTALGYTGFRIFFKFRDLAEREEEIVAFILDKVAWAVRVRGNWDFNVMIFTKNYYDLETFLQTFKNCFQDILIDYHVSLITRIHHYRRGYLLEKAKDTSSFDTMGETSQVTIDKTDLDILETIQNHARMQTVDIARKINVSERIVRYRLKNLVKNNVILGFRSLLDINRLHLNYYKVHFKLNIFDQKTINKINTYAHYHPNIIYKTDTIGGYDLELEIQTASSRNLYEIIDCIISTFPNTIQNYNVLEYDKEYKLSYLNTV